MLNLRQHLITEILVPPMATLKQYLTTIQLQSPFTQHTPHIHTKDLKTSENHKEPKIKRRPNHNQTHKAHTKEETHISHS